MVDVVCYSWIVWPIFFYFSIKTSCRVLLSLVGLYVKLITSLSVWGTKIKICSASSLKYDLFICWRIILFKYFLGIYHAPWFLTFLHVMCCFSSVFAISYFLGSFPRYFVYFTGFSEWVCCWLCHTRHTRWIPWKLYEPEFSNWIFTFWFWKWFHVSGC